MILSLRATSLAIAAILSCGFLLVAPLTAQQRPQEETIQGELQFAPGSDADSQRPAFVLVDGESQWQLVVTDSRVVTFLKRSIGRRVEVNGYPGTRESADGSQINELQVISMVTLRPGQTSARRSTMPRRRGNQKRFEESQLPLTEEEKSAALENFATDSGPLDADLQLKHPLTIVSLRSDKTEWRIQPDGSYEMYKYVPVFLEAGKAELMAQPFGAGQLSPRQLVMVATLMDTCQLLELPAEIGGEDEAEPARRGRPEKITLAFGEFGCSGGRAYADSDEAEEIKDQKERLSRFTYGVLLHLQNNLHFQDNDEDDEEADDK